MVLGQQNTCSGVAKSKFWLKPHWDAVIWPQDSGSCQKFQKSDWTAAAFQRGILKDWSWSMCQTDLQLQQASRWSYCGGDNQLVNTMAQLLIPPPSVTVCMQTSLKHMTTNKRLGGFSLSRHYSIICAILKKTRSHPTVISCRNVRKSKSFRSFLRPMNVCLHMHTHTHTYKNIFTYICTWWDTCSF